MFVPIANEPRHYAWGSRTLLAEYLGLHASGDPEAELWLGAHPGCPSILVEGERAGQGLDEALTGWGRPQPTLLLKVLAAAEPLSLQAHPDAARARVGFDREEALGIARDAPERSYRDPFAKPELIVAVSPFEALTGFRPVEDALRPLEALARADSALSALPSRAERGDALAWLLSRGPEAMDAVAAAAAAADTIADEHPVDADTMARIARAHPNDPGILVALLLNRVSLAPGEALFLPAGNLHAYLEGLGIELMGPSDNVLRGGLTPKHVDVRELLAVVDSTPLLEPRLPSTAGGGAVRYRPDGAPFELRRISGTHRCEGGRGVLLAVRGAAVAIDGGSRELGLAGAAWLESDGPFEVRSGEAWLALERDTPQPAG